MEIKRDIPKIIKFIAWLWIIGGLWKLSMSYSSWPEFELWRNIFLFFVKSSALLSGILLLKGYKEAAFLYFTITIINTIIFYSFPPNIKGIEVYFTLPAIAGSIAVPLIFAGVITYYWKSLTWARL
jgi:hypothetical protein